MRRLRTLHSSLPRWSGLGGDSRGGVVLLMEDYRPMLMTVEKIRQETPDIRTFFMKFKDAEQEKAFSYKPGQFLMLSVIGEGESTFCLTQSPTRADYIEATVKLAGRVTEELHNVSVGTTIGLRGPYGNAFPTDEIKGRNIVFVAGGVGMAPVRSLLNYVLDNRGDYGHLTVIYGARSPKDLSYQYEFDTWRATSDLDVHITVDPAPKGSSWEGWDGAIGFVPTILEEVAPSADNSVCITCGPPIMIKFTLLTLAKLGFKDDDIVTTLENRMQCGIGKCGRCNVGKVYVCKDGPVFTNTQLKELPEDF